jgi:four helix bundle protein
VRAFIKKLPKTIENIEDGKQLIKASGSVDANYIEANESLSKKDFTMRIKICRKEAKESRYWLNLIDTAGDTEDERERKDLVQEASELINISAQFCMVQNVCFENKNFEFVSSFVLRFSNFISLFRI